MTIHAACAYALAALCPLMLTAALPAHQDYAPQNGHPDEIETITVVAPRTERPIDAVAATVSIKTAEELNQENARNIADAVRYEPGVSVGGTGARFGLSSFNIRGVGGNRVLTIVDGIRVPDEFSFGPFLSARRDLIDIDSLSQLQIARGPISSLYGSDALGGVVALRTKLPADYLDSEESYSASLKAGYSDADESFNNTLELAGRVGAFQAMLLYTNRSGNESDNTGSVAGTGNARERPDPLSTGVSNFVSKLVVELTSEHRFTLSIDDYEHDTQSHILSDHGLVSLGVKTDSKRAEDTRTRHRWSLGYLFAGETSLADRVEVSIYAQTSDTAQRTIEHRTTPMGAEHIRFRESKFRQKVTGAWAQFLKRVAIGSSMHRLSFGMDYYATQSATLRRGSTTDKAGTPVREFTFFPTRDFPPTTVRQFAAFVQDEISLFGGRLTLTPGLRIDRFDADAEADSIYLAGNPGTPLPEDFNADEVTFKLGALYALPKGYSLYARYAEGFRAPPYDDVNVGFTNPIGGYKTISSPNLASESSRGIEMGLRWRSSRGSAQLARFENHYENFIESRALAPTFSSTRGIDPSDGLLTFQSINRGNVRIDGWELRGHWNFNPYWSLTGALAYASGEDEDRNAPLNSIEPLNAVLSIGYEAINQRWGVRLACTLARDKNPSDIDPDDWRVATDGYRVFDLLAHFKVGSRVQVHLGAFNLTNERYIRWIDTAGIGDDAPARFSQPGTNAAINLHLSL